METILLAASAISFFALCVTWLALPGADERRAAVMSTAKAAEA